jgi:hypothetical protein
MLLAEARTEPASHFGVRELAPAWAGGACSPSATLARRAFPPSPRRSRRRQAAALHIERGIGLIEPATRFAHFKSRAERYWAEGRETADAAAADFGRYAPPSRPWYSASAAHRRFLRLFACPPPPTAISILSSSIRARLRGPGWTDSGRLDQQGADPCRERVDPASPCRSSSRPFS